MNQRTMKIFQECAPVFSMLSDGNRQNILVLLFDNGNHCPVKKIALKQMHPIISFIEKVVWNKLIKKNVIIKLKIY